MKKLTVIFLLVSLFVSQKIDAQEKEIPCEDVKIGCLILGREVGGEHIIRTNTEYQNLMQSRSPHSNCGNYQLPNIDFNNYTLIGYISAIAGCNEPQISHSFISLNNVLEFKITITQQGLCERNNAFAIWCLVPKIDENKNVKFNIITQ